MSQADRVISDLQSKLMSSGYFTSEGALIEDRLPRLRFSFIFPESGISFLIVLNEDPTRPTPRGLSREVSLTIANIN